MVRYLSILTLSLLLPLTAKAVPLRVLMENTQATNNAIFVSTQTGSVYVQTGGSMTVKGASGLSVTYGASVGSMTVVNGLTASSGTFTATGNTQYSLATSSGISNGGPLVNAGTIRAQNSGPNVFSIVTSSGIKTTQINWADGTVSTTAATGGGGAPGAVIASGTVSGGAVGVLAGSIAAGTTLYFDSAGLIVNKDAANNAAVISVKNLTFVASTQAYVSAGTAMGSGLTFAGCQGSTGTITTGNNSVTVSAAGAINSNAANDTALVWLLWDGAFLPGYGPSASGAMAGATTSTNNSPQSGGFSATIKPVTAGAHTFCVGGAGNSGSATFYTPYQVSADERATGGAGYSVPASTQTIGFTGSFSGTVNGIAVAGTTVTMTTRGGDVMVTFSGTIGNSANARTMLGAIVDGGYVCGQTPTSGLSKFYQSSSDAPYQNGFSCRVSGLAAGSHTFALTGYVVSGTGNVCGEASPASKCVFRADEIVGQAGSGDMSSNGLNAVSGTLIVLPAAVVNGLQHRISSGSVSGVSSITWTLPTSTRTYTVKLLGCVQNTSNGSLTWSHNSDSGSNYAAAGICSNGAGNNAYGQTPGVFTTSISQQDGATMAGNPFKTEYQFTNVYGTNKVWGSTVGGYWRSDGYYMSCNGADYYTGSAVMSSVKVTDSAGTFSCTQAELWESE